MKITNYISLLIFMIFASSIMADTNAGEQINWQVLSSGGNTGTSTNYSLSGTVGQTSVGTGSSTSYVLRHGYWQNFSTTPPGCCIVRGDAKHDNQLVLVDDIVYLVDHLFKGGPPPPCTDEGDAKADNGLVLVDDIVYLVDHLFKGGPAPPAC